jgi:hypothetical protein
MKNVILILIWTLLMFGMPDIISAQDWELGGNNIIGTEWFGADNTSSIPVSFEHRANHASSSFLWSTTTGSFLFPLLHFLSKYSRTP